MTKTKSPIVRVFYLTAVGIAVWFAAQAAGIIDGVPFVERNAPPRGNTVTLTVEWDPTRRLEALSIKWSLDSKISGPFMWHESPWQLVLAVHPGEVVTVAATQSERGALTCRITELGGNADEDHRTSVGSVRCVR